MLLALALIPVIILLIVIYKKDKKEKEPVIFMFGLFLKSNKFYVTYLAIYLIYFMFDSIFQGVSYLTRWNIYKNAFIFLLCGAMLLDDITNNRVSISRLRNFFVSFLIFELLLSVLQYIFEPVREFFNISYIFLSAST